MTGHSTGRTAPPERWLWSLGKGDLCRTAQRRTGLSEYGTPALEPALSILLNSLDQEANLHTLGRFLMRVHLRDLLETRLRLEESWKTRQDSLGAEPIHRPVFIVGMPRSGSTFLHELLTEDPDNRAPRVYEVMFPLPRKGENDARRIRRAELCLWFFRRLAPRADAVYPMRALTPHECVAIHSYTFLSEEFISTCDVPSYEAFLRVADLTPAYAWQRRFLQHLQLGSRPRRWIFKSPDHVYGLNGLFGVFPDASIIQTHRNPLEVLKSSADLTRVLRGLYGRPGAIQETREREARLLAQGMERIIQFRKEHPELADRFIDVDYRTLVAHPVAEVARIYDRLGRPLTDTTAERIRLLASNRSRYVGRKKDADPARIEQETAEYARLFQRYFAHSEQQAGHQP